MDSNTFWWFLELLQFSPNLDPLTLYLSPKYLKSTRTFMGTFLKHIFINKDNLRCWQFGRSVCQTFWKVGTWHLENMIDWQIWKSRNEHLNCETLKFGNVEIEGRELKMCELEKKKIKKLKFGVPHVYQILWSWAPENDENWLNKISKIMDMNFISIRNMKWKFINPPNLFYFQVKGIPSNPTNFSIFE